MPICQVVFIHFLIPGLQLHKIIAGNKKVLTLLNNNDVQFHPSWQLNAMMVISVLLAQLLITTIGGGCSQTNLETEVPPTPIPGLLPPHTDTSLLAEKLAGNLLAEFFSLDVSERTPGSAYQIANHHSASSQNTTTTPMSAPAEDYRRTYYQSVSTTMATMAEKLSQSGNRSESFYLSGVRLPLYVTTDGLSQAGEAVIQAVTGSEAKDGINPSLLNLYAAKHAVSQYLDLTEPVRMLQERGETDRVEFKEEVVIWLQSLIHPHGAGIPFSELEELTRSMVVGGYFPLFKGELTSLEMGRHPPVEDMARTEMVLADTLFRYLDEMGALLSLQENEEIEHRGTRLRLKKKRFADFVNSNLLPAAQPFQALTGLRPAHPQYAGLAAHHQRYRKMAQTLSTSTSTAPSSAPVKADGGGFPPIGRWDKKIRVKEGEESSLLPGIRARLTAEGFLHPEDLQINSLNMESLTMDSATSQAIRQFQHSRGLMVDGVIGHQTLSRMIQSPSYHVNKIGLNMRRWRESALKDHRQYHIRVNVPEYYGEMWDNDGERLMRFRVIVGSARKRKMVNPDTGEEELVRIDATVPLDSRIINIVFNPEWRVPPRLQKDKLEAHLLENPNWYQANNYEYFVDMEGVERVRQLPGEDNTLGAVKLLFPNKHDIYMHDTNAKNLFKRHTRAFSAGCIRVENPMDLVLKILERDGTPVDRLLEKLEKKEPITKDKLYRNPDTGILEPVQVTEELLQEKWVRIRQPVPISIQYITTTVDDDGLLIFWPDIYELDKVPLQDYRKRLKLAAKEVPTPLTDTKSP